MGKSFTVCSINPGIGVHLLAYQQNAGDVRYVLERLKVPIASLLDNVRTQVDPFDSRYYYNRKQKGLALLLDKLGVGGVGDLDVLDLTSNARSPNEGRSQNLFDCFGVARRVKPKIVLGYCPLQVLYGRNPETQSKQELELFLDYLRFDGAKRVKRVRQYLVVTVAIDSADYGSGVSKQFGVIIAIRSDVASKSGIASEGHLRMLLPSPSNRKPLRQSLKKIDLSAEYRRSLTVQTTAADTRLVRLLRDVVREPELPRLYQTVEKRWKEYGYSKTNRPLVLRSSLEHPLPILDRCLILHPNENRPFASEELRAVLNVPKNWEFIGTESERSAALMAAVPREFPAALVETLFVPLLQGSLSLPESRELQQLAIKRIESPGKGKIRTFLCDSDIGFEQSKTFISRSPNFSDYDYVFDADDINEDFVVFGPYNAIEGKRDVIGAIRRRVLTGADRAVSVDIIKNMKEKTDKRVKECPLEVPKEQIKKWESKGIEYMLSEDRRRFKRKTKKGVWDTVWRSVSIPSSTVGWTRDKITGLPQRTAILNDPDIEQGFRELNSRATGAYRYLAFDDFVKQARFVRKRIPKTNTISAVFTTMAVNRYGAEMPAMNYHIDAGDDDSGLTTISVFQEGHYEGGLFVLPRYRCAFRVGDGDIFVANSRQVHGVSRLEGTGKRLSVVSYTKTSLAAKENLKRAYPAKSPRPKFRVSDYQVAIPSYMRDETLRDKTLRVLERYGIDPRRVTIFVANKSQEKRYAKTLSNSPYKNLVVAEKGIKQVRNFMWNYYPEGTPVLFMDDDLTDIQRLQRPRGERVGLVSVENLYEEVIRPGFTAAREYHCYLWGIYAANNPLFMSSASKEELLDDLEEEISTREELVIGNQYIIGSLFGAVIRHKKNLLVNCADKEDHERSVLHFIQDGRTLKLKYVTVESNYYGEKGGLQEFRTLETVSAGAKYMKQKYSKYVRIENQVKTIKSGPEKGRQGVYLEVKHI